MTIYKQTPTSLTSIVGTDKSSLITSMWPFSQAKYKGVLPEHPL